MKKRDPNLKLLLAIGGWTHSSNGFTQMVATRASRGFFIKAAIKYLKEYGMNYLELLENIYQKKTSAIYSVCRALQ